MDALGDASKSRAFFLGGKGVDKHLWNGGAPAAGCIDIFHHAAFWVVGLARELDLGKAEADIPGLILYGGQVAAMRVPLPEILASLAGAGADDSWMAREKLFWRQAIRRFMVSDPSMRGHHLQPGDIPPPGVLHHVELRPSPRWLPFSDIILGLERLASAAGVPGEELLFRFHGLPMLDGTTLLNAVRAKPREQDALQIELDKWRDRATRLLPEASLPASADLDGGTRSPPCRVRGLRMTRRALARVVGRTERQLRRWDREGRVPTGEKWHKAAPTPEGHMRYDMEQNWAAVASMIVRARDPRKDSLWLASKMEQEGEYGPRCF